ncbi:hypothetical protein [Arsukibacterium sp.]|uniref:hypothetical protein n=1 Tax=Arsukibacterium sp. TaxID=1977258 RepID=UPI0035613B67
MSLLLMVVVFGILAYALWRYYLTHFSALAHARKSAHLPLSANALQTAIEEAESCGVASAFNAYIEGVQCRLGRDNLQVGHLLWIFDQLEENLCYEQNMIIPTFAEH